MASLRDCAREVLDVAREGIGYIVVWKERRGWKTYTLWPRDIDRDEQDLIAEEYDADTLTEILKKDPAAVLLCSEYDNLGGMEDLTLEVLANALRWQYEECHHYLADWMITSTMENGKPQKVTAKSIYDRVQAFARCPVRNYDILRKIFKLAMENDVFMAEGDGCICVEDEKINIPE